ncbi:proton-coupled amino acid transporter 2-like [Adelges cooleyi]|uniref:proton-coupled amino acid transporter 2-like n=1 Tax=Adelges cooleyi TaxID=133065 RepID=UPI0021803E72|nr:proton-coupled amino acid transporter 2-like [Adelges cooleyi]
MDGRASNDTELKQNGSTQTATADNGEAIPGCKSKNSTTECKKSGYMVTLMHFIKGNIGCGMLAMGEAFKCGGLYVTFCMLLYVWIICVYNMHLLTSISKQIQIRMQSKRLPTFGETVENAFKMSDKWVFRSLTKCIRKIVLYNILITQLGLCSVYIVFITTSLRKLLIEYEYDINFHNVLVLTMPLILGCASLRQLRFIAPLSTVANFALITGVFTIMYYSCRDLNLEDRRYSYGKLSDLPMMFGIIMFSFEGIGLVLPLFSEIKYDKSFTSSFGVLNLGMLAVMLLNVPLGMTGYMKWGDDVKSSLTLNLPYDDKITQFVILMMILGIACSYALQFYPAAIIVYSEVEQSYGPFDNPARWDYGIRILVCLATFLAAGTVPHLDLFMSLVGSITCVALTLAFPALSNMAFRKKCKGSLWKPAIDWITISTSLAGFLTGTYTNSIAIYQAFLQTHSNG